MDLPAFRAVNFTGRRTARQMDLKGLGSGLSGKCIQANQHLGLDSLYRCGSQHAVSFTSTALYSIARYRTMKFPAP